MNYQFSEKVVQIKAEIQDLPVISLLTGVPLAKQQNKYYEYYLVLLCTEQNSNVTKMSSKLCHVSHDLHNLCDTK